MSFLTKVTSKYKILALPSDGHVRDKIENETSTKDADDSYLRVVWGKETTLKPQDLTDIYQVSNQDIKGFSGGAFYVGDPDFWYEQLSHDYGRSGIAYVVEIKTVDGDFVTEDVSYGIPPETGTKGYSKILVTSRSVLHEGKDFKYVREIGISDEDATKEMQAWEDKIVKELLAEESIIKQLKTHSLTENKLERYALNNLYLQPPKYLDIEHLDWDDILRKLENSYES